MNSKELYTLGIDIGSTTVKIAILDNENEVLFSDYERHFANIQETLSDLLGRAIYKLGPIQVSPVITGSGGLTLAKHLGVPFVQEVIAVSTALQDYAPQTDVAIELGGEDEQKDDSESAELMQFVKETLGDKIKEAKVSHRLKTHPVCLTAGEGFSFEMEKYFKNFQMPEPIKAERILELNVDHPAVKAMAAALATDRDKAALYAKILYDQANLIAGLPLEDPSAYTDMVAQLMQ